MEILVQGAVTSAVYALLAVGFTLIFGVARVINLAHGSFFAVAAYLVYVQTAVLSWPFIPAIVVSILLTSLFGMALERVFIRPMRHSHLSVIMITLAVSLFVEQMLVGLFTTQTRNIPSLVDGVVTFGGVAVAGQRALTFLCAIVLVAAVILFIRYTKVGSAILAISQDPEAAEYVGISANRTLTIVMAISAGLAACAAILASPFLSVEPSMGLAPMVKAFTIVIVGGLGSVPGSVIAACVIGMLETVVSFKLSSAWAEVVSVAAVFLTLTVRPSGLLGKRELF